LQLGSFQKFSCSGEFRDPTFPGFQRFGVLSPSYRQVEQRLPAICNLIVPLFTLQEANPFFHLGPALFEPEDLPVLGVIFADVTFSDDSISRQSLITRLSFRFRRETLSAATVETPIREKKSLSFSIRLGVVVKVTSGDFLVGSDWEDGFQFWSVSLQAK
jgi:hypothetical protein